MKVPVLLRATALAGFSAVIFAGVFAGCATTEKAAQAPQPRAPAPPAPVEAAPPPPPPPVVPPAPPKDILPAASPKELKDEADRLAGMQKRYFAVFKIEESGSGLKASDNKIGVFELRRAPRGDRLRLAVSQAPSKPARLAVGTYNVSLDTVIDYVETQTCIASACKGKQQKLVRSLKKVHKIQLSPRNGYSGGQEISLVTPGTPGSYRSTYSDVVLTVKRISVAPVAPAAVAGS
jgi:hypothetical protein